MVCFGVLTYGVYVAAVAIAGYGLWFGVFSGRAPIGLTLVPAIFATAVIIIALSMLFADRSVTEFLERRAEHSRGRASKWWRRAAAVPRSIATLTTANRLAGMPSGSARTAGPRSDQDWRGCVAQKLPTGVSELHSARRPGVA